MAAMSLRLTFCLLTIGFAYCFQNGGEYGQLKRYISRKEKVIYFKAFLPHDTAYWVRNTIVFSGVQHNIGGAYNPTTGIFTAPVTGLYEFKCRVQRISGAQADITLINQGRRRASTTSLTSYGNHGVSAFMKVKRNDHVHVGIIWTSESKQIKLRGGQFTQFSGILIQEL